jgi:ATP-binding cassette subfamily F protein 3
MLEKLVIVQVDEVDTSALKLKFPSSTFWTISVIVKDLSKSYGDHVVFKDANIVIEEKKVAFVGKKW